MTDTPEPGSIALLAQHLTRVTSGESVARDVGIVGLMELVQAPTEAAWLALLVAARVDLPVTRRPTPTVTDGAIPASIAGRILHVYRSKSSTSGASIAFILVASASDPSIIYGPIMLFRPKDIRCAMVSDVVWTVDIRQPTAEARAARAGGLRASGTMLQND